MIKWIIKEIDLHVALYTSAWIEISYVRVIAHHVSVALYTSAWIEISNHPSILFPISSRTLHECVD